MKNYNMILPGKQQKYQHKYEYITSKEILPPDQNTMIKQVKLIEKALEKQTKTIGDQGRNR